jgi:predicted phage tail protein
MAFLADYWAAYAAWGTTAQVMVASLIVIGGYALISYGIHLLVESILGQDDPDAVATTSYVFRGPENVADQGSPVPLAYGRLMSGSKVISVSISSVDKSNDSFMREDLEFSAGSTNIKEGGAMLTRAPAIL